MIKTIVRGQARFMQIYLREYAVPAHDKLLGGIPPLDYRYRREDLRKSAFKTNHIKLVSM